MNKHQWLHIGFCTRNAAEERYDWHSWRLTGFTVGASPSDWHIEMARCAGKKCLVEKMGMPWWLVGVEPTIPGAWIDD